MFLGAVMSIINNSNFDIKITEVGRSVVGSDWDKVVSFFPYYRFYYIEKGEADIVLIDRTLHLEPNYLYFIPPFSIITATCKTMLSHYWIHFNLDVTTANYLSLYEPILKVPQKSEDEALFLSAIENFDENSKNPSFSKKLTFESLTKYFLSKFIPDTPLPDDVSRFFSVLNYIDTHLGDPISNADLCDIIHLNPNYFSNLFKKTFGKTPKQHINEKKIVEAAKMLLETNLSIKEISFHLGF